MPIDKSVIVPSGHGKTSWVPAPGVSRDDPRVEAAIEALRNEAVVAERIEFERERKKNPNYEPDPWETYPTLYEPHLVPNDDERKKIFYWVKKSSSYTAWERAGRYYKAWLDVFREAYRETVDHPHPEHGQLIADSDFVFVLTGYACFEEAVARLKRGDKTPFKFLGVKGHFSESWRPAGYWNKARSKGEDGDIEVTEMYSPYWPQISDRLTQLSRTYGEVANPVLERKHTDVPAPIYFEPTESGPNFLSQPRKDVIETAPYAQVAFPSTPLPPVPAPKENILIATGTPVPCSGIWEPVKADLSPGFIGLFRKPVVPPDGKFEVIGSMNYLHQGSPAPTMAIADDGPRREGVPVVWRLLWEDTRYRDGVIPDEEKNYVFFEPRQEFLTPSVPGWIESPEDLVMTRSSGDDAPCSGVWAAQDFLHVRVTVREGQRLPKHEGRDITWVYVPNA